jgi:purine-binding chemotaxis protein CheW
MTGEAQVVVFAIDDTLFALPVTSVREILDVRPAFRMPSAPAWLIGLIDLRGQSVPVIDLRRFGDAVAAEPSPTARILIVEIDTDGEGACMGLLVDQVLDVMAHRSDAVEAVPAIVPQRGPWRLCGVLRRGERFVGLLDMTEIVPLAAGVMACAPPDVAAA